MLPVLMATLYPPSPAVRVFRTEEGGIVPKELPSVGLNDGQTIVITGKAPLKVNMNSTKTRARVTAAGTYVEPTPEPEPEPIPEPEPPPVSGMPTPTPDPTTPPPPFGWSSLAAAVAATPAGGTLDARGKVFAGETVTISKPITLIGGKLVGSGQQHGLILNADGIIVLGTEVTGYNPPTQNGAVRVLRKARIERMHSHHHGGLGCAITVRDHADSIIMDSEFDNAVQAGYHSTNTQNVLWYRNNIHHCNLERKVEIGWEAGIGKVTVSRGTRFIQNLFHDVWGHGIWADIDVRDTQYLFNRVWNCSHSGIFYEISEGAVIEDNVVYECGWGSGETWAYGAGIQYSSSKDGSIKRNVVAFCNRGISVIAQSRGSYPVTSPGDYRNIRIEDNVVIGTTVWLNSWVDDRQGQLFSAQGNGGASNRYWHPSAPGVNAFEWQGKKSLAGFNATPADENGRYLTLDERNAILAQHSIPVSR